MSQGRKSSYFTEEGSRGKREEKTGEE